MALNRIEHEWSGFSKVIFYGMTPSRTQREEMRKSFFAGALAVFAMIKEIGTGAVSEQTGVDHLDSIEDEFDAFAKKLMDEFREMN